jgi:hypothetical protein
MIALIAVLALAGPPKATLDTGSARVPLAISAWCWGTHCGAPVARASKTATVTRGATVTVELTFVPKRVRLAVAGAPVATTTHGRDVSWTAARGGGLTLTATGGRGWVTYVGRLRLH